MGLTGHFVSALEKIEDVAKMKVSKEVSKNKSSLTLKKTADDRFCILKASNPNDSTGEAEKWISTILAGTYGIQTVPRDTNILVAIVYQMYNSHPKMLMECFVVNGASNWALERLRNEPVSEEFQTWFNSKVLETIGQHTDIMKSEMVFASVNGPYEVRDGITNDDKKKLLKELGLKLIFLSFKSVKNQQIVVKGAMQVEKITDRYSYMAVDVDGKSPNTRGQEGDYALVVKPDPSAPRTIEVFSAVVRRVGAVLNLEGSTFTRNSHKDATYDYKWTTSPAKGHPLANFNIPDIKLRSNKADRLIDPYI
eukprot:Platyproteum_vivax@DN7203_c0_g1_i3.p1